MAPTLPTGSRMGASVLVALGAGCFSLMGLFVKLSDRVAHTTTFSLLAVRCALGLGFNLLAVVASVARRRRERPVPSTSEGLPLPRAPAACSCPQSRRAATWLAVRALGGFGCIILEYMALRELPLATNTMIVYSSPAFIVLWASMLLGERIRLPVLACLVLCFAGLLLIVQPWRQHVKAPLWAYGASLVSAMGAGLVYVALSQLGEVSYVVVLNVFLSTCLVLSLAVGSALSRLPIPPLASRAWVYLLAVGLSAYAAEVCMTLGYARASGNLGQVSVLKFLSPIFSTIWGTVFLGETLRPLEALGAILVVGASAVILYMRSEGHANEGLQKRPRGPDGVDAVGAAYSPSVLARTGPAASGAETKAGGAGCDPGQPRPGVE